MIAGDRARKVFCILAIVFLAVLAAGALHLHPGHHPRADCLLCVLYASLSAALISVWVFLPIPAEVILPVTGSPPRNLHGLTIRVRIPRAPPVSCLD